MYRLITPLADRTGITLNSRRPDNRLFASSRERLSNIATSRLNIPSGTKGIVLFSLVSKKRPFLEMILNLVTFPTRLIGFLSSSRVLTQFNVSLLKTSNLDLGRSRETVTPLFSIVL